MKQYMAGIKNYARSLAVLFAASLFALSSCSDEKDELHSKYNFELTTRANETAATLIPNIRLFNFYYGTANDKKYRGEVLNMTRTSSTITAQVETGIWNMALVAAPSGTLIAPNTTKVVSELPMYKYAPTLVAGKSTDAAEIYLDNKETPQITTGTTQTMTAQLNRTVAKVELLFEQTTPNFDLSGAHTIRLCHVPTTISYTGALLPSKTNPDTIAGGLTSPVTLTTNGSFLKGDKIEFIIPAHRGDTYTANGTPTDVTTRKMAIHVRLQRTGGGYFDKYVELDKVAICNHILRVKIKVNDGIEFNTSIEKWERVDINSTVGKGYQNWLYVKKGATGNGLSWNDALPDINDGIAKANALIAAGKTVNGILVAGGSSAAMLYSEGFTIPAGMKIFGGWAGTPGTELPAGDATAPYTSTDRDLKSYKVHLATSGGDVLLPNANSVLDGFVVTGKGSRDALVDVTNASAWINAIEIDQQTIDATYALRVSAGTATNVLVSRNNKGVSVINNGKLVSATIANNTVASILSGTILNTIYWGNSGTATITGTINHCAFQGTAPTGTNYPLNATNNVWFTSAAIKVPGPHFNMTSNASVPYYAVNTATPNRAPQLARGDETSFDDATLAIPATYKQDIIGNPRHHNGTDIGCYESTGTQKGFEFRWNMKDIYISPKILIESDHLALLFDNSESAYVDWEVTDFVITSNRYSYDPSTTTGSGNTVNLGTFKLKSSSTVNSGSTDLNCGSLVLKCKNIDKSYFPDVKMTVFQSPATPVVWTAGYAGSFHRWNETGPRYVFGTNSGKWIARIISGHDWIKIDNKARPANPDNDTEVEETFGGFVEGTGNIVFRVGMKSKLASVNTNPRYGLISITRTASGKTGVALFFVRQGEKADYLYGPADARKAEYKINGVVQRTETDRNYASKFTVYNITDPQGRFDGAGVTLGKNGGRPVDYPSKTGYFFKYNDTRAFYPDASISGTNLGTSTSSYNTGAWDVDREVCPPGYHTPTEPELTQSYFLHRPIHYYVAGNADGTTFVWGRYADGYFDKYAATGAVEYGTGPNRATNGLLIYNDYNNASVFFPTASRWRTGQTALDTGTAIAWYWTSSTRSDYSLNTDPSDPYKASSNQGWATHSYNNHLGVSCTVMYKAYGGSVRCVEGNTRTMPASPPHDQ